MSKFKIMGDRNVPKDKYVKHGLDQVEVKHEILSSTKTTMKYLDHYDGFCKTHDDWYGTWAGKYVAYSKIQFGPGQEIKNIRFCGNDDYSLIGEFKSEIEVDKFICELPEFVDQDWLADNGFYAD